MSMTSMWFISKTDFHMEGTSKKSVCMIYINLHNSRIMFVAETMFVESCLLRPDKVYISKYTYCIYIYMLCFWKMSYMRTKAAFIIKITVVVL